MDVLGGRDQHHVGFDAIGEEVVVMRIAPAGWQSEIPGEGMAAQVVHIDDGDGLQPVGIPAGIFEVLIGPVPGSYHHNPHGAGNGRFVFHRNPPKGYIRRRGNSHGRGLNLRPRRTRCGAARPTGYKFRDRVRRVPAPSPGGRPSGKRSGREAAPAVVICGPRPDPAHAGCGTGCRHHGPAGRYGPTY